MARILASCSKCKTVTAYDSADYVNPVKFDDLLGSCWQITLDGTNTPWTCGGNIKVFQITT